MKRVVITGMAIASPLGSTLKTAYDRLQLLENCIKKDDKLDEYENLYTKLCARVEGFKIPDNFTRKVTRTMGPVSVLSCATVQDALIDAGLINDSIIQNGDTAVCYGSSSGSLDAIIDFYSFCIEKKFRSLNSGSYIKMMPQTTAVNISLLFKTTGRLVTTSTACTSGSMAIGNGYELIKNGVQKIAITGGAEEMHVSHIGVFDTLYATSTKNSTPKLTPSPFDKDRDGLVIGEGAGTLILEEYEHAKARGAKIYAEVIGFATNTDGTHITNPNSETMAKVMEESLKSASLTKNEIGYINAHGTGTISGDIAESKATEKILGCNIPVSTIKSYTGHTLGACGAIEAILSIEMMNNNWFCPNLNLVNLDENCAPLNYITNSGINKEAEFIISNNFAFGGINTSLIFKRV